MKKLNLLLSLGLFATSASICCVGSGVKVDAGKKISNFTFVERAGTATTYTVDAGNVSYKGGWDSQFLVAYGENAKVPATKTTFEFNVSSSDSDSGDAGLGFVIFYDEQNYITPYFKWSNCGTVDGLHIHAHSGGAWANIGQYAKCQWDGNWDNASGGEWLDNWSDYGGWSKDSDTPTGDEPTGNWNHFRSETALAPKNLSKIGISIERTNYKDRDCDKIQAWVTGYDINGEPHTWYTAAYCTDVFTNPYGGADHALKAKRPQLGLWNYNLAAVTYGGFNFNGNTIAPQKKVADLIAGSTKKNLNFNYVYDGSKYTFSNVSMGFKGYLPTEVFGLLTDSNNESLISNLGIEVTASGYATKMDIDVPKANIAEEGLFSTFKGYVTNIPSANYGTDLTGKPYATVLGTKYYLTSAGDNVTNLAVDYYMDSTTYGLTSEQIPLVTAFYQYIVSLY